MKPLDELLGGPADGARVPCDGSEWLVPIMRPVCYATMTAEEALDTSTLTKPAVAVYRGALRHPDRAHRGYKFAGYR
jgi:hypothetical protein